MYFHSSMPDISPDALGGWAEAGMNELEHLVDHFVAVAVLSPTPAGEKIFLFRIPKEQFEGDSLHKCRQGFRQRFGATILPAAISVVAKYAVAYERKGEAWNDAGTGVVAMSSTGMSACKLVINGEPKTLDIPGAQNMLHRFWDGYLQQAVAGARPAGAANKFFAGR